MYVDHINPTVFAQSRHIKNCYWPKTLAIKLTTKIFGLSYSTTSVEFDSTTFILGKDFSPMFVYVINGIYKVL